MKQIEFGKGNIGVKKIVFYFLKTSNRNLHFDVCLVLFGQIPFILSVSFLKTVTQSQAISFVGKYSKILSFNYFVKIYNQNYRKRNAFSAIDQNMKKNQFR